MTRRQRCLALKTKAPLCAAGCTAIGCPWGTSRASCSLSAASATCCSRSQVRPLRRSQVLWMLRPLSTTPFELVHHYLHRCSATKAPRRSPLIAQATISCCGDVFSMLLFGVSHTKLVSNTVMLSCRPCNFGMRRSCAVALDGAPAPGLPLTVSGPTPLADAGLGVDDAFSHANSDCCCSHKDDTATLEWPAHNLAVLPQATVCRRTRTRRPPAACKTRGHRH